MAGKKPENRRHLLTSPRASHAAPLCKSASVRSKSVPERKINVHIANGHAKTLGPEPEASKPVIYEKPKNQGSIRKDKDPKSFTQTLFDTVAMKLLHRVEPSRSHPPWAPSNQRAQGVGSSNLDNSVLEPKVDRRASGNAEKDVKRSPVLDTGSTEAAHGDKSPQNNTDSGVASIGSNATSSSRVSIGDTIQDSEKDSEKFGTSDNDRNAHLAVNTEVKDSNLSVTTLPSKFQQPDCDSDRIGKAGTMPLHKTSVFSASQSRPVLDFSAQSLSHFTSANIIALNEAMVACGKDLHEQHCLLKFLGRTDLPQHSSRCGSYGEFLAYSGQSMTYVLSNVDALLQSFLHCDDSSVASKVVRPYEFPWIVDLFRILHGIDMHPQKIFPSLWVSAARLYPMPAITSKRRPLKASELDSFAIEPFATSQGRSLNDLEACHVVKIIFAALVASVPKCSPMTWLAVRKLHASGQVAPFVDTDNSPAERKVIGKLVRTLQVLENEMALGLIIRLARSIDIRYHLSRARALAEDAEKNSRQFPPTFSRVLDYVNSNRLNIDGTNEQGQPSVKCGEWMDPEIETITWHRKEWIIIIEWLRAVILKEWDGKAKIAKGSAVGGALGLLLHIRR